MTREKDRLWICFALREEAAFIPSSPERVRLLVTGMGAANARHHVTRALRDARPEALLSCGFAGALDPALPLGALVLDADPAFPLTRRLLDAGARPGRFHFSSTVLCHARDKAAARELSGADAVEMESHAIRSLCGEHGIPSATLRVISDQANEDLPVDFNRFLTPDWRLSYGKLLLNVVRRPGMIGGLLQLRRQSMAAARVLARALDVVMGLAK